LKRGGNRQWVYAKGEGKVAFTRHTSEPTESDIMKQPALGIAFLLKMRK